MDFVFKIIGREKDVFAPDIERHEERLKELIDRAKLGVIKMSTTSEFTTGDIVTGFFECNSQGAHGDAADADEMDMFLCHSLLTQKSANCSISRTIF